jgi:hypothetical protein
MFERFFGRRGFDPFEDLFRISREMEKMLTHRIRNKVLSGKIRGKDQKIRGMKRLSEPVEPQHSIRNQEENSPNSSNHGQT